MSSLEAWSSTTTLDAVGSFRAARLLARMLLGFVALAVISLFVVPWQQSVTGRGRVIAYAPVERQQAIDAPVAGRVVKWHVQEGDRVSKGDVVVALSDNDPDILERLARERTAVQRQLDAAELSIAVAEGKVASLEMMRAAATSSADFKRQAAVDKRSAAEQARQSAEIEAQTSALNLARVQDLHPKGLASTRDLELARMSAQTTAAKLGSATAKLSASEREVSALTAEREKIDADSHAKVQEAQASLQKSRSDAAKAQASLAKMEVRLAQQQTMEVRAPREGTVFRLVAREGGEFVKAGDVLAILVPETAQLAVELWLDGNDVPLVYASRHVRLQFEGWPAVQFVGWPSVAVGTFRGDVAFVDATDDGAGDFRVVIVPTEEEPWPESRYLRQGVRANGWVLLNRVSIGYELWRQFNGFPPMVTPPSAYKGDKP